METPQDIERMALEARVTMTAVLNRANVARESFYRAKRGDGSMTPLTTARLVDAVKDIKAEAQDAVA